MNLLPYNSEATTLAAIPIAQNNRIGGVDGELKCFQKGREEAWGASACMQRHPHEIRIITICAPISAPRKGRLYNVRRPCKTERSTIELIHDLLKPWWHWTEHSEIFSMRTVHLHICILIISDDFSFGLIVRTVQERNLVPAVLSLAVVSSLVTGVLLPVWPGPSTRLQLHLLQPLMTVCTQEETRSYRDQGGTTANYTDHVLTEIAADNYVSQQTVEQSIILTAEQRRPVQAGPDDNEQSNSHLRRWRSCCSQISHLTTSRPLSFTEK